MSDSAFFDGVVVLAEEVAGGNLDEAYGAAGTLVGRLFFLWEAAGEIMDPVKEPFNFPGFRRLLPDAADPAKDRRSLLHTVAEAAAASHGDDGRQDREAIGRVYLALAAARERPARLCGVVAPCMAQAVRQVCDNISTGLEFVEFLGPLADLAAEATRTTPEGHYAKIQDDPRFVELAAPINADGLAAWLWEELKEFDEYEVHAELDVEFSRAAAWRIGNGFPVNGSGASPEAAGGASNGPEVAPRPRKRPAKEKHRKWVEQRASGLTYGEIVERHKDETGETVERDAVMKAVCRWRRRLAP